MPAVLSHHYSSKRHNSRFAFRRKLTAFSATALPTVCASYDGMLARSCVSVCLCIHVQKIPFSLRPWPPRSGFIRCKTMNILNHGEKWIFPVARIRAIFPVKNQRRALHGISLSTRERARFIIDTTAGRVCAHGSRGKQCMYPGKIFTSRFNLILQGRHVFITPLFDRANRQRVGRY